jgi:hypothetical protein
MRKTLAVISLCLLGVGAVCALSSLALILNIAINNIEHDVTLEFASPHPGVTYFLVCRDQFYSQVTVERLKLTDGRTAHVKNDQLAYWSRHQPLRLCAMPNEVANDFNEKSPEYDRYENWGKLHDWFDTPAVKPRLQWSEQIAEIPTIVPAWNPQKTIVRRYQVTHTTTELKADLVEERNVYPWNVWTWMDFTVFGGAGVLSVTVVVWLIVWLVRKARRS